MYSLDFSLYIFYFIGASHWLIDKALTKAPRPLSLGFLTFGSGGPSV